MEKHLKEHNYSTSIQNSKMKTPQTLVYWNLLKNETEAKRNFSKISSLQVDKDKDWAVLAELSSGIWHDHWALILRLGVLNRLEIFRLVLAKLFSSWFSDLCHRCLPCIFLFSIFFYIFLWCSSTSSFFVFFHVFLRTLWDELSNAFNVCLARPCPFPNGNDRILSTFLWSFEVTCDSKMCLGRVKIGAIINLLYRMKFLLESSRVLHLQRTCVGRWLLKITNLSTA